MFLTKLGEIYGETQKFWKNVCNIIFLAVNVHFLLLFFYIKFVCSLRFCIEVQELMDNFKISK